MRRWRRGKSWCGYTSHLRLFSLLFISSPQGLSNAFLIWFWCVVKRQELVEQMMISVLFFWLLQFMTGWWRLWWEEEDEEHWCSFHDSCLHSPLSLSWYHLWFDCLTPTQNVPVRNKSIMIRNFPISSSSPPLVVSLHHKDRHDYWGMIIEQMSDLKHAFLLMRLSP